MPAIDPVESAPQATGRLTALLALCLAVLAALVAGFHAYTEQQVRNLPLDVDGWGHLVGRLQDSGHDWRVLFREPSLWKGPIVPFVFGLCYFLAPFAESVLVLNAAAFALSAAGLFLGFCYLGARRVAAAIAVLGWIFYLPHAIVFGYYFAEPVLALLSGGLFLLVGLTVRKKTPILALASGVVAGLLLLARAPFLFVVAGLVPLLWFHVAEARGKTVTLFVLGCVIGFSPWTIRNYLVEGRFIPFTIEGGKILFQGTYVPGEAAMINRLREMPEFVELEAQEKDKTPVDRYGYWQALALEQIKQDPRGQLRLCLRKLLAFWVYLPPHSWAPAWKTGLLAAVCLPLAALGAFVRRRCPLVQICALWVGGLWMFHAIVHAELRYNFPILPMMLLLAVLGFASLVSCTRRRTTLVEAES